MAGWAGAWVGGKIDMSGLFLISSMTGGHVGGQ